MTAEARAAILARYVAGEAPGPLAREYGITASAFHHARKQAGIPSRRLPADTRARLEALCTGSLLPVYPVVLVSRPGDKP